MIIDDGDSGDQTLWPSFRPAQASSTNTNTQSELHGRNFRQAQARRVSERCWLRSHDDPLRALRCWPPRSAAPKNASTALPGP